MALNLNERYPGRFNNPTAGYPQGSYRNRTSPTAKDGSYLEQDWANDKEGFFQSLLVDASITANGEVDSVGASQYRDALRKIIGDIVQASSPVVGSSRNVRMSVPVASATATLTADQIVVGTSLIGATYRVGGFNKTVNLSGNGVGGMDVGTAPVSGFVAVYAIYNPLTGVSGLLATNATTTLAPEIYGGANMPSGYTASALLSVWITNASRQFVVGSQIDRRIGMTTVNALSSSTVNATPVALAVTFLPKNAKFCSGALQISSTATSVSSIAVFDSDAAVGGQPCGGALVASAVQSSAFSRIAMQTVQQIRWSSSNSAGTPTFSIGISSYEI
jgi:hypothetical protein